MSAAVYQFGLALDAEDMALRRFRAIVARLDRADPAATLIDGEDLHAHLLFAMGKCGEMRDMRVKREREMWDSLYTQH